jgi:hypothetical protein
MEPDPGIEVSIDSGIATVLLQGEKSINDFGRSLLTQLIHALTDLRKNAGELDATVAGFTGDILRADPSAIRTQKRLIEQ